MKKIYIMLCAFVLVVFAGCVSRVEVPGCDECPCYQPPAPGWCSDGKIVISDVDSCGCRGLPKCEEVNNASQHQCTEKEKTGTCELQNQTVCGWHDESIQCFAYPCAQNFESACSACKQANIAYWTEGSCPATGSQVGADKDSHGCIGSAGYSWCEEKQKCLRVWEENCTLS